MSSSEFSLKGDLSELEAVCDQVARFCGSNGLASDVEFDLNLVLEELFTNSLKHGGCKGLAVAARVELQYDGDAVSVVFADRGPEFDPLQAPVPDLTLPLAQRASGGLGIHLVRQVMRDLRYERVEGWNRLVMRRSVTAT